MLNFTNKTILVTGGAGVGVGGGVCSALDKLGAELIIVDKDEPKLVEAVARYHQARGYTADISTFAGIDDLFSHLSHDFPKIHGLVNNAGIGLSKEAHEASEIDFDRLMAVNFKAVWRCSSRFAELLIQRGQTGQIVNISSIHAHSTQSKYALYCSSKNAIQGLTMGMAVELGKHGIRVNAVGPGYVHAEQNFDLIRTWSNDPQDWVDRYRRHQQAIPRFIEAEDVGYTVAFLLSELARSITGQTIFVDNGTTSLLFGRDFSEF